MSPERWLESLESRRLYATFTGTDFFAMYPGKTAHYQTFLNLAAPQNSAGLTPQANPVGASGSGLDAWFAVAVGVRQDTQIRLHTSGDVVGTSRTFRDNGRRGIAEHEYKIGGESNILATIAFTAPTPLVPQRFSAGDFVVGGSTVSSWSNLAVTATLNIPGTVLTGQTFTGTNSGRTIATDNGASTLLGFGLTSTVQLAIDHSLRFTTQIGGQTFNVNCSMTDQLILAKGVGQIGGSSTTLQVGIVGPGVNTFVVFSAQHDQLTASSELSSFTRITGSTLRVGGTNHADVIGAGFDGGTSSILVVRNGVSKSISASAITRIAIDSAAGDDYIGPLKLGRMKSVLIGGLGNDNVVGGSGRDLIYGGDGNDILVGGPGIDTLFGEAGNDILNGLNGADSIDGGPGTDTAKLDNTDTRIAIEVLV